MRNRWAEQSLRRQPFEYNIQTRDIRTPQRRESSRDRRARGRLDSDRVRVPHRSSPAPVAGLDEQFDISLDGTATAYVNASIPALVALRGIDLDPGPTARLDRARVRQFFTSAGVRVTRISPRGVMAGGSFTCASISPTFES